MHWDIDFGFSLQAYEAQIEDEPTPEMRNIMESMKKDQPDRKPIVLVLHCIALYSIA